ncbi:ABC transporter permease family protein [Halorussus salinisoli]|uniref:hypothetical protein n=1 Tax=Halorussus salinisoli TaxID=2558242 RepID=UPI0010C19206|nr:hypothetical protein [Halorussus salinisoli]
MFSLFFADLLGVLVVEIFVLEEVLYIEGIGNVGLTAIHHRDLPLILGVTMVIAFAGIVGNLIQDLAYLISRSTLASIRTDRPRVSPVGLLTQRTDRSRRRSRFRRRG